jgi:hypothetical protein
VRNSTLASVKVFCLKVRQCGTKQKHGKNDERYRFPDRVHNMVL